jgi:hypothetical protein
MFSQFQHGAIDFAAGSPKSTNIPAGGMINEILCEYSLTPTITAANNVAANIARGDGFGPLKSLVLKGEGALPIFDIPGSLIPWISYLFDYGVPLAIPSTLGDGVTANPALTYRFILPQWSTRSGKPFDSSLDNTAEPNGLTLTANWGQSTDFAALAAAFTVNPSINVWTLESKASEHPFLRKRRYVAQQTFNATGTQRLYLEPGNAYRRFLINTRDGSDVDQSARFTTANLYIGGQQRMTTSEGLLAEAMRLRAGLISAPTITKNTKEKVAANYLWENAVDGYLTHAADTSRRQGNYLEFVISTAPTTVTVVYEVLDDLRDPAKQVRPVRTAA